MDYRYFPEPDLPPLTLTPQYIQERSIDMLPIDKRLQYRDEYMLIEDDARILSADRYTSEFYDTLVRMTGDAKKSCSYITTVLFAILEAAPTRMSLADIHTDATQIGRVIQMVIADELSSTSSKVVIESLVHTGGTADEWVHTLGLKQSNDISELENIVQQVLADSPTQLAEYMG
jgi:aspartyl-tRNA(Asn)/glutamyl-tRNA(Gln) amidotransferase subunit B